MRIKVRAGQQVSCISINYATEDYPRMAWNCVKSFIKSSALLGGSGHPASLGGSGAIARGCDTRVSCHAIDISDSLAQTNGQVDASAEISLHRNAQKVMTRTRSGRALALGIWTALRAGVDWNERCETTRPIKSWQPDPGLSKSLAGTPPQVSGSFILSPSKFAQVYWQVRIDDEYRLEQASSRRDWPQLVGQDHGRHHRSHAKQSRLPLPASKACFTGVS